MDDPVFDFYKGFYKKASSWFVGTLIVLVVIIVIGIAYITISKLNAKNDTNENTNEQTTEQPLDSKKDTQMDEQDLFEQDPTDNGGYMIDENGEMIIDPNDGTSTTLPENELGL